jgi:electron transfer flavoprotein alpha subunit
LNLDIYHYTINTTSLAFSSSYSMLAHLSALRGGVRSFAAPSTSRLFSTSRIQLANTLLFIEHKNGKLNPGSLVALTAASKIGGEVDGLVVGGDGIESVVDLACK